MKRVFLVASMSLLTLWLAACVTCKVNLEKLGKPVEIFVDDFEVGEDWQCSVSFSWPKVANAVGYEYVLKTTGDEKVAGGRVMADVNVVWIDGLCWDASYVFGIKAIADNETYVDSDWAETEFYTPTIDPLEPVVADRYSVIYNGEYSLSEKPLALVYVVIADSANPYTRCQIAITVPMPEDVDKVAIPTGKFSFTEYANAENQVLAGTIDGGQILYTTVVSTSPTTGYFAGGYLLKSGEVTIDKNADGTYNVHVLANGTKVAADGGSLGNYENIEWTLENAKLGEYAMDGTNPSTNITEDKTFTNEDLPNTNFTSFVDSTTAPTMILWRFVFSNGDIEFSANDQTQSLNVSGNEGEAVELQFVSDYSEDISVMYGEYTFDWNAAPGSACAALPVLDYFGFSLVADCFSPFGGCWYLDMHADMKGNLAAIEYAGIVPGKESKLRISGDGTNAVFEFEMFDKYGNGISGIRTVAVAEMVEAVKAVAVMPLSIPEVSKTVLPY